MTNINYRNIYQFGPTKYCNESRWKHYYKQLCLTNDNSYKSYLVIGPGDHIVPVLLKHLRQCNVDTFDIREGSTYKGDIKDISKIINKNYDCLLCCEVLEHIEIEDSKKVIKDLIKIANKSLIISLPIFNGMLCKYHKWEINHKNVSIDSIFKEYNYEQNIINNIVYIKIKK